MPTETNRTEHSFLRTFATFFLVLLLAGGGAYGLFRIVATADSAESKRVKTRLDERIETAREIRAALSKPQPPIERLPPITAKLAHPPPESTKVVGMDQNKRPARLPEEARAAFAMDPPRSLSDSYDRPTSDRQTFGRGSYDRAVGGGF